MYCLHTCEYSSFVLKQQGHTVFYSDIVVIMTRSSTVNELVHQLEDLQMVGICVRVAEARVVEQIRQARIRESLGETPINLSPSTNTNMSNQITEEKFRVGQRVYVTNAKTFNRKWPEAVVTKLTPQRVYIMTETGTHTWRMRKHLKIVRST